MTDEQQNEEMQKRFDVFEVFEQEFIALQEKHGVVPIPTLRTTPYGIVPELRYFDKAELEKQTGPQAGPIRS